MFSESDALLTALVLLTVAASAFAGVRLFALLFAAPPASVRATDTPRRLQDVVLALLALGALGFGAAVSAGVVPIGSGPADDAPVWLLVGTFAIALASSVAAWLGYRRGLGRAARLERAMRWARGGLGVDALYGGVARAFAAIAEELDAGAGRMTGWTTAAAGSLGRRTARTTCAASDARVVEALILTGTVVLLAFWSWSAR